MVVIFFHNDQIILISISYISISYIVHYYRVYYGVQTTSYWNQVVLIFFGLSQVIVMPFHQLWRTRRYAPCDIFVTFSVRVAHLYANTPWTSISGVCLMDVVVPVIESMYQQKHLQLQESRSRFLVTCRPLAINKSKGC